MNELIAYLMTMGMTPEQAMTLAVKLQGPVMRNTIELGPAEVTPLQPQSPQLEMEVESVRPTDRELERRAGGQTYNRGPVAAGRVMHSFGMNERDAGKVAEEQGYQKAVMNDLPGFLVHQYGFPPEIADFYARKMVTGGPNSEEATTPIRDERGTMSQPWETWWGSGNKLGHAVDVGMDAETLFKRNPGWGGK